jgi:hypothetical protein
MWIYATVFSCHKNCTGARIADMRNFDKFEDSFGVEGSSAARFTLSIIKTEVRL